jgi:hypothetical protein
LRLLSAFGFNAPASARLASNEVSSGENAPSA